LSVVLIMSAGCGTSPEQTSQAPDEQQPASAPAVEPLFPRVHDLGDSTLTVYEPQVLSHEGYTQITFWVAAVDEAKADGTQSIGAIKGTADMVANFEARTITLYNRRLDEIFFPELSDKERNRLTSKIKSLVRNEPETMPLDVVLAYIAQGDSLEQRAAELSMEPPDIFYAGTPAVLVQFGGEPVFKPLGKDTVTSYAVNTNWDVVQSDGRYYLLLGKKWISSASLQGPWQPAAAPVRVDELPDTQQFARVRQAIPGEAIAAAEIPQVRVVTKPAELIVTDGDPVLEDVADTGLAFVSNTSHDIIYQNSSGNYYLLLSGRWFEAKQLKGPWSAVESLPQAFSRIPPEHDRAHVRVAIPGTDEAKMAVIESNIPNTASVPRGLKAPKVRYSGHPKFETIKGTQVSRAVNTPFDILRVGDRYYLCHEAVWFESDRPEGPWIVADHVPKAIYTIPADSPAYHVIFVKVYEADEDEVVVGYTSGYQSTYVSGYTVVYGTGYYWPPYWAYYPWYDDHYYWYDPYPYYWYDPYPYSYGSASYYNPVTGSYRHGDYVYGPYGGYGTGESYNERTGRRSQSEYSWDYNSVEYSSNAYNPKRGTTSETSQQFQYDSPGSYESWGESTIKKGDDWIQTRHYSNQDGRKFAYETSAGGKGARVVKDDKSLGVAKSAEGDLYVGGNGEVYRRDSDGNWQKRDSGSWNDVQTPSRERVQDRAASVTSAQRDALRQRSTTTTDRTRRYDSRRTRSMDRGTYQQLNRSYGARSYGNARFGGSRGSFSGGGFSRGGGGFSRGGGRGGGGGRR
jgi:hypothetical protein